jgi:hypothetical protein
MKEPTFDIGPELLAFIKDPDLRQRVTAFHNAGSTLTKEDAEEISRAVFQAVRGLVPRLARNDAMRFTGVCVQLIAQMSMAQIALYDWADPKFKDQAGNPLPEAPLDRYALVTEYAAAVTKAYGAHRAKWLAISNGEAGQA